MKTYKGRYRAKNPEKYRGDSQNIIYRSGWERKLMVWLDTNPNIIQWSSEEVVIPYRKPVDNKIHRYFPDFYAKMRTKEGKIKEVLMEVKPLKETVEPQKKSRVTKQYINEVVTWSTNQAKWNAAREYCSERGWEFSLITEKELGL